MSWLQRLVQRSEQAPRADAAYTPARRALVDPADPELAGRAEERAQSDAQQQGPGEGDAQRVRSDEAVAQVLQPSRTAIGTAAAPAVGAPRPATPRTQGPQHMPLDRRALPTSEPALQVPAPDGARSDVGEHAAVLRVPRRTHELAAQPQSELAPPPVSAGEARALQRPAAQPSAPMLEPHAQQREAATPSARAVEAGQRDSGAVEPERRGPAQALLPRPSAQPEPAAPPTPQLSIGRVVIEVGAPAVKVVAPAARKQRRTASAPAAPARRAPAPSRRFGLGVS